MRYSEYANQGVNPETEGSQETDDVLDGMERAIELLEEALGEWVAVRFEHLPEHLESISEARDAIQSALNAYREQQQQATCDPETKQGNECRSCTNWVDVEAGFDTCTTCLAKA